MVSDASLPLKIVLPVLRAIHVRKISQIGAPYNKINRDCRSPSQNEIAVQAPKLRICPLQRGDNLIKAQWKVCSENSTGRAAQGFRPL
jgi:hypothetical protein